MTSQLIQENIQKAGSKPVSSFDGKYNQTYFTVIGYAFNNYHFTRNDSLTQQRTPTPYLGMSWFVLLKLVYGLGRLFQT